MNNIKCECGLNLSEDDPGMISQESSPGKDLIILPRSLKGRYCQNCGPKD